jgi:SAM-dependent methyltransferase
MSQKDVFTDIYKKKIWGDGSEENPLSGGGSNPSLTTPYVEFIRRTIESCGIKSVLDVGHGDWTMWRDYRFENVSYIGIDVAREISNVLNEKYGNDSRRFLEFESRNYEYPSADLIISKEVLQHLPNEDLIQFLEKISKYDYIVLCNGFYPRNLVIFRLRNFLKIRTRMKCLLNGQSPFFREAFPKNNIDIPIGGFRGLDLETPNFARLTTSHEMISKFDFGGPRNFGVVNRVYFYKRKSQDRT